MAATLFLRRRTAVIARQAADVDAAARSWPAKQCHEKGNLHDDVVNEYH
jgi:hypothetical protein